MSFADFQEAMVITFGPMYPWFLVAIIASGIFGSVFVLWLQFLRIISRLG